MAVARFEIPFAQSASKGERHFESHPITRWVNAESRSGFDCARQERLFIVPTAVFRVQDHSTPRVPCLI